MGGEVLSQWREHRGGACPTDPNSMVRLRYAGGWESKIDHRAGGMDWSHSRDDWDIIAYQVVSVPQEARG
jgi:hypothetical protein